MNTQEMLNAYPIDLNIKKKFDYRTMRDRLTQSFRKLTISQTKNYKSHC